METYVTLHLLYNYILFFDHIIKYIHLILYIFLLLKTLTFINQQAIHLNLVIFINDLFLK